MITDLLICAGSVADAAAVSLIRPSSTGKTRFSPASAAIVHGSVRQATGLPYQFGSLP